MAAIAKFDKWLHPDGRTYHTPLQVKFGVNQAGVSTTSTSTYSVVDTVTITPRFANSKILLLGNYGSMGNGAMAIKRDTTFITYAPTGGNAYQQWNGDQGNNFDSGTMRTQFTLMYYDTPNTTSAVTYTTNIIAYNHFAVNQGGPYGGSGGAAGNTTFSGFLVMEIQQ